MGWIDLGKVLLLMDLTSLVLPKIIIIEIYNILIGPVI